MMRLLFMLLTAAVMSLGTLAHASMDTGPAQAENPCNAGQMTNMSQHCPPADHAAMDACAVVCVGSVAIWPQHVDAVPMTFGAAAAWSRIAHVLSGRLTAPADRPPKSI